MISRPTIQPPAKNENCDQLGHGFSVPKILISASLLHFQLMYECRYRSISIYDQATESASRFEATLD